MTDQTSAIRNRKETRPCIPFRYVQVLMMFLGMTTAFSTRVAMSLAVVAMTDKNSPDSFDWSIQRQSVILSSFTWGYITLQGISGEIAVKFGGMNVISMCIGVNSVVSLFLPTLAIYGDWVMVCICRGVQGVSQGALLAVIHYLISKWVPLHEKSRMTGFIFAGGQFGTACQLIVSGYIANYWGWAAIFYCNGIAGIIWTAVYLVIGSDSPQVSRIISVEERLHIQSSLNQIGGHQKLKTPWKSIFTSLPFFAVIVANTGLNWGFWTLLTEIPTYMSNVVGIDIKSNGVLSALPYIAIVVMSVPIGIASDYAIKKQWVSVTACRKISNSVGFLGPAAALICLAYVPAGEATASVTLLIIALSLHAGFYNGYILVFLDMAPNFASTLMGLSNFFANVISLFAPLTVGFVLKDETNPKEWRVVFYITAILYMVSNTFFVIFGTSKKQKWNSVTENLSKA